MVRIHFKKRCNPAARLLDSYAERRSVAKDTDAVSAPRTASMIKIPASEVERWTFSSHVPHPSLLPVRSHTADPPLTSAGHRSTCTLLLLHSGGPQTPAFLWMSRIWIHGQDVWSSFNEDNQTDTDVASLGCRRKPGCRTWQGPYLWAVRLRHLPP